MSEQDYVPPGGPPVAPVAGWYQDPGNATRARFWDGQAWTEQVTAAPHPGAPASVALPVRRRGSGQQSSVGCVFYVGLALLIFAVVVGLLVFLGRHAPKASNDGAAVGACRYFVTARLQNPTSARFSDEEPIAPVSGDDWTVTGAVRSRTPVVTMRRNTFTCTVEPMSTAGWRLVRLRFAGG